MDRRTFLSAGTVALCSPLHLVRADNGANAAEHYRKAFSLVPEIDRLRWLELYEAENNLFDGLPAAPVNPTGLELLKRSDSALREMARGAALKECDWGEDFFANFLDENTFPMVKVSKLGKLACLRASYSFQNGQSSAAIRDVDDAVKMAHDIGGRGPFMATLMQFSIENSAIDVVAAYLPRQNAKILKLTSAFLEAWKQQMRPLSEAMQGEKAFLLQHERPQYLKKSPKEAFELLRGHELLRTNESDEEAKAIMKANGGTIEGLVKQLDAAAVLYDELARIWDLPAREFKPAVSAFRQKHARNNPLAVSVLAHFEGIRFASDRTRVRFAMLNAALTGVSGGPGQLQAIKDPFGDGPFDYRPFQGGFELKSKLQGNDRLPTVVTVGRRAKD
jgi:hypothetical protein